ncbi:putative bifunctional diguanylate cyclase/phosphodiesterase [Massilia sp. DWR3-1-1]|uniref:putative bifunctional diguanylate cyclase/phosphodiesterase n=1 Tax=Massilia sp. DWR3-1-1 TaxID=2804559 RepID=UPI003CE68B99
MRQPLKVLLVEDCEDDAALVERALRKGGFDLTSTRVHDAVMLAAALAQPWDVVLSDFSMPGFSGMDALMLCRSLQGDVPFILVSGTVGEETAVAMMKAGANDYVMKHNLARLAPALQRELHDARARASLRRTELELIDSEKRFHAFMDASPFVASIKDHAGCYLYMNKGWSTAFGVQGEQWIGKTDGPARRNLRIVPSASDLEVLDSGTITETIDEFHLPNADVAYWQNTRFPFIGASGQRLLGEFSTDVTALKASEETIRKLAFLDPLTGLPNRRLMQDRLLHALAVAARSKRYGALLFLDLDNFKTLNDTHGHDAGDEILKQTGQRLSAGMRAQDTVARTGGDEFVIIIEQLDCVTEAAADAGAAIARKIIGLLDAPYMLNGNLHRMSASIGIALFCDNQPGPDELMKRADIALYSAKAGGRNTQMMFDPAMQARIAMRNTMEADLRLGLEHRHFVLYFQAQVDHAGTLIGVEALLRLQHPDKGLIMPAAFIGLAEDTGLIHDLGCWAIETACAQLCTWSTDPACAQLTIAVNVSARQMGDAGFVARVLGIVEGSGANPHCLILELTESLLLDEVDCTISKIIALRRRGIRFSLDDFGTGFSSLSYLKRLPLYEIKIDRSFVQDVINDTSDAVIVRAIIALAHSFGLSVIAEGVETLAQRDFLTSLGCSRFQGYLFGRPVPVDMLDVPA